MQETIAEKVKLKKQKRNRNQNLNSKQTINWTSSIVSTNKNWKQFIQTKKQKNKKYRTKYFIQILYLLYQHNKITQQFNQVIIIMEGNRLVITTEPNFFYFDLPKDTDINLKHEIYSIIKQ